MVNSRGEKPNILYNSALNSRITMYTLHSHLTEIVTYVGRIGTQEVAKSMVGIGCEKSIDNAYNRKIKK